MSDMRFVEEKLDQPEVFRAIKGESKFRIVSRIYAWSEEALSRIMAKPIPKNLPKPRAIGWRIEGEDELHRF
jgi:hypothetical protein